MGQLEESLELTLDFTKPFTVLWTDGSALTLKSEPVSGERDYTAALTVCVPPAH